MRIDCDVFAHNNDKKNIKMNLMNENKKTENRMLSVKMIINSLVSFSVSHKNVNYKFFLLSICYRN